MQKDVAHFGIVDTVRMSFTFEANTGVTLVKPTPLPSERSAKADAGV